MEAPTNQATRPSLYSRSPKHSRRQGLNVPEFHNLGPLLRVWDCTVRVSILSFYLKGFQISYIMLAPANRFRVYGKRILALSRNSIIAKTIIPHSFLQLFSGLQNHYPNAVDVGIFLRRVNHYANTVDGGICWSGFGCKGLRKFSGGVWHNTGEDDEDGAMDSHEENEEVKERYVSPNETPMWKVLFAPHVSHKNIIEILEQWVKQGNVITQTEFCSVMRCLMKQKLYKQAFQVSSWVSTKKPFKYEEDYYATNFGCILRCQGYFAAEKYLSTIPSDMKGVKVYRVLLRSCDLRRNVGKAQFAFQKMKELEMRLPIKDYNTMLSIYCRFARGKVEKFLKSIQNANVKPNAVTYRTLIVSKGLASEVDGMIELLEKMKAEGVEPDAKTLAFVAKQCIKFKRPGKAEEMLNELETQIKLEKVTLRWKRVLHRMLVQRYALLNKEKDVERLWNEIESDAGISAVDYLAGICAWGKVGNSEKAEKIFDSLTKSSNPVTSKHYNALFQVYATQGLGSKAEEILEKMLKTGKKLNKDHRCTLVRLYVNMGNLQKAESMLCDNYDRRSTAKFDTYLFVMKKYAAQGEMEGAERVFSSMKQARYRCGFVVYENLLQGYINAKIPATGLEERLKADKCLFYKKIQELLQQANRFQEPAPVSST